MTVSLEGQLKTPAGGFHPSDRKITTKSLFKTYDLSASFSYGTRPLKAMGLLGN